MHGETADRRSSSLMTDGSSRLPQDARQRVPTGSGRAARPRRQFHRITRGIGISRTQAVELGLILTQRHSAAKPQPKEDKAIQPQRHDGRRDETPRKASAAHRVSAVGRLFPESLQAATKLGHSTAEPAKERRVWQANQRSPFGVLHRSPLRASLRPLRLCV